MINPPNFVVGNPWCDECKAEHPIGSHLYELCAECLIRHPVDIHRVKPLQDATITFTDIETLPSPEMQHLRMWATAAGPLVIRNMEPTTQLRWLEGEGVNTLQQKWVCKTTGHVEWRDIPVEKAHVENQG